MKSYRKELWFNPPTRVAFIRITETAIDGARSGGSDYRRSTGLWSMGTDFLW